MCDKTTSSSTEEQRFLARSKANQQLFGRSEFKTKSVSLHQNRINPYSRPQRSVSPLIISRPRLQEPSIREYHSPPSSPVRAPTPLWTPPPSSPSVRAPTPTYGSDEDDDPNVDSNDC